MTESEFIRMMQRDGWQALDAGGSVVKSPRTASRQWEHSKTGQKFNGEHVDVMEGKSVVSWRRFAEAGQTPPPFQFGYYNAIVPANS